jgi:hypothetical protein
MTLQIVRVAKNGLATIFKTTNTYCKPFAIYGSDGGKIPNGITYTLYTAIDSTGSLVPDPLYTDCKEAMQDVLHGFCGNFSIKVQGFTENNSNSYLIIEYKILDTAPIGTN